MNIDVARFADEMSTRAKALARLAPRAAAVTLRVTRLLPDISAAATRHTGNRKFSPEGQRDLARQDLTKVVRPFVLAKAAAQRNRDALPANRANVEEDAFAKFESDPMGPEIRQALRSLSHGQAVKLAASDTRVLAAIVNAPQFLHGIDRAAVQHLVDGYLATNHPKEVAQLEAQKEACDIADGTLKTATALLSDAGQFTAPGAFDTRELDKFLAEHGPSESDLQVEASGGVAKGEKRIGMMASFDLIMSDHLQEEAA